MKEKLYRICERCVMDTTDPDICFDDRGFCNHCNDFYRDASDHTYQGAESDEKLSRIIQKIKSKGRNKQYDCLIGISGGVDSTYVAYLAKKLGLRPLIVHFDNGWDSELSIKNIENIVRYLGFDYQTYVVDWEEFKDIQLSFLKASLIDMETPTDHAFLASLYTICAQYRIRYIITGSNYATECILPKAWSYNAKDLYHLNAVHRKFGTRELKSFPRLGFLREFYYTYFRGIRLVRLLQMVPYVKKDAMKILSQELGWNYYGGKHYESLFTKYTQAYILPLKFNVDKRRAHLSTLICNGELTRDEALKMLTEELYPADKLRQDTEYFCKKLGLTDEDFRRILGLPVRKYTDYPNSEVALRFVYRVYNMIRKLA